MPLEWEPIANEARGVRSKCGRYSVCSITIGGEVSWETWRLAPGGPWFARLIGGLGSEVDAKAAAESDLERRVA